MGTARQLVGEAALEGWEEPRPGPQRAEGWTRLLVTLYSIFIFDLSMQGSHILKRQQNLAGEVGKAGR